MMTRQGMEVLSDLFRDFSNYWVETHPGCNGNDIERAFLYLVSNGMSEFAQPISDELREKIEKIR